MSEHCQQCTDMYIGENLKSDLAGLISKRDSMRGMGTLVLCEGCGSVYVDHVGNRLNQYIAHVETENASIEQYIMATTEQEATQKAVNYLQLHDKNHTINVEFMNRTWELDD